MKIPILAVWKFQTILSSLFWWRCSARIFSARIQVCSKQCCFKSCKSTCLTQARSKYLLNAAMCHRGTAISCQLKVRRRPKFASPTLLCASVCGGVPGCVIHILLEQGRFVETWETDEGHECGIRMWTKPSRNMAHLRRLGASFARRLKRGICNDNSFYCCLKYTAGVLAEDQLIVHSDWPLASFSESVLFPRVRAGWVTATSKNKCSCRWSSGLRMQRLQTTKVNTPTERLCNHFESMFLVIEATLLRLVYFSELAESSVRERRAWLSPS